MAKSSLLAASSALLLLSTSFFSAADAADEPKNFQSLRQSDVKPLVNDLVGKGFSICAAVVQPIQGLIPAHSTLLLPTNEAIANVTSDLSQQEILRTLQCHVITFPASFQALSRKEVGSELPTLLRGGVLKVTSNSPGDFALNDARFIAPDVCQSTRSVACHGIDRVIFCNSSLAAAAPFPSGEAPAGGPGVFEGPASVEVGAPGAATADKNRNAKFNTTITSSCSAVSDYCSLLGVVLAWLF